MPELSEIPSFSPLRISHETQDKHHEELTPEDSVSSAVASQDAHLEPHNSEPPTTKLPKSSMYPDLHGYVTESLEGLEYSFRDHDTKVDIKREYHTNIMGEFHCQRSTCLFHNWESNSIAIIIREYEDQSYNVLVYHQLCRKCMKPTRATLDKLCYSDRVAYHLKRWNGIDAKQAVREVVPKGRHMEELCEGCIKGYCSKKKLVGKGL